MAARRGRYSCSVINPSSSSVEVDWLLNERVRPVESAINAILQTGTPALSVTVGTRLEFRRIMPLSRMREGTAAERDLNASWLTGGVAAW